MINNDIARSDSRRVHKCPFTSVVVLHKESNGIVHASPVQNANITRSRTYLVKRVSKQISFSEIVLARPYLKKHSSVMNFAIKPKYSHRNTQLKPRDSIRREHCEPGQNGEEVSTPVLVTGVSTTKKLKKLPSILLTVGGILLLAKHKKLIGLVSSLGGLLISAMTVSKK